MDKKKIIEAKKDFFSRNKIPPKVIVMNYDTALMAFSRDEGGGMVCFDLLGKDKICDMKLIISGKLKNDQLIVGGDELIEKYKE